MRIGLDAKRIFHNATGLGNYGRALLYALAKHTATTSDEIHLFSPSTKDSDWSHIAAHNELNRWHVHSPQWSGVRGAYWRSWSMASAIQAAQLDIYDGLSHELPIPALSCATVVTVHDVLYLRYPQGYGYIDRLLYTYKYGQSFRKATHLIAISQQTKDDICTYYHIAPEKITVIPPMLDECFLVPSSSDQKITLRNKYQLPADFMLFVGGDNPRKNLTTLIDAYQRMLETDSNVPPLVVLGTVRRKDILRKMTAIQHSLQLLGHIPNSEVPTLYQMCTVLLYPSLAEGFGLPIVEGLASQVPVVAQAGGCFEEAGGQAYYQANVWDTDDLIAQIYAALQKKDWHTKKIHLALQQLEQLNSEQITRQRIDLYQQIIQY